MKMNSPIAENGAPQNFDGFNVNIDTSAQRADIVLHRPPLNVISMRQREELAAVFHALDQDEAVRIIIIKGAGEHFSSGGNIPGFLEMSPEHLSHLADNIAAPSRCSKPVIAEIRGYCFGVGFELSLACDFRIVGESAVFSLPEMRLGMIPGSGGSARLLHMIGITRTKNMVMRAQRIPARQAFQLGFVTECVPDAELGRTTNSLIEELKRFSPLAQRTIKRVLNQGERLSLDGAVELEGAAYGRLRSSEDFQEGVAAFIGKRTPQFIGR
jgi:2-oxoglutaroyl-CoA hydrolase